METVTIPKEEFETMTTKLQANELVITNFRRKHQEMISSNESLQSKLEAMTLKYNQLTESSATSDIEHRRKIKDLETEIAMMEQRMDAVNDDRKEQSDGMRSEWKKALEEVGSLKEQLSEKKTMIEDKVLEMSELTIKYEESLDLLRQNEREWDTQKREILENAEGEHKEMEERHRKEVEQLHEEMEKEREQMERIKEQFEAMGRVNERLKKENREMSMVITSPPEDESASKCYLSNITMAKWFK